MLHGSLDALITSSNQIESDDISINIIHSSTGEINENDILLANVSEAIVIGFRVSSTNDAKKAIDTNNIDVKNIQLFMKY